jgi:molybdopterin/thiamine biosynthesis adenylyltransferase
MDVQTLPQRPKNEETISLSYFDNDPDDRTKRYFGKEGFDKLTRAKILIIGAGAIGNEVIKNFIMLGVQKLLIVDFDTVNKSNSNRCIFFREQDHNKVKKVEAVKKRASKIRKGVNIEIYDCKIQEAPEHVWDVDLIVLGVDNDYVRYFVNAWLVSTGKYLPVINGAMGRSFLECEVLIPGETACLTCLWQENYFKEVYNKEIKKSCDEFFLEVFPKFPAISTFTSIVGGIMVGEAAKILTGELSRETFGYLIRLNLEKYEFSKGVIMRNPRCVEKMCAAGYKEHKDKNRIIDKYI